MNSHNRYYTRVIACPDCNGAGEIMKDPGFRSRTYDIIECPTCEGSGRLIRRVKVEYAPFEKDAKIMVRI